MTGIAISESGLDQVVTALDRWAQETASAGTWLGSAGLGATAIAALTGHGLVALPVMFDLERLAARTLEHGAGLTATTGQARDWGGALLGSQVMATSSRDWFAIVTDTGKIALDVKKDGKWAERAYGYALHGRWSEHASRWKAYGPFKSGAVGFAGDAFGLAGAVIGGASGAVVGAAGGLGVAAYGLTALWHDKYLQTVGGKVAARVMLPLAALEVGVNVRQLAGSDLHELAFGDAARHSDNTRSFLYGAKVLDTVSTAALAVAPFSGPALPVIAGVGLVLMGASALIDGAVAVTDLLHEHHVTRHSAQAWASSEAKHAAALLPHFSF